MTIAKMRSLSFLPICLFLLLVVTLVTTYTIAVLRGDVEVFFPYISETGGKPPESCIFGQFVNVACVLLLATLYVRFKEVDTIEGLPSKQINGLNKVSAVLGVAATLGMSVVANFQDTNVFVVHRIGAYTLFVCMTLYSMLHTMITYLVCPEYSKPLVGIVRLLLSLSMFFTMVTCFTTSSIASAEWMNHHNPNDTEFFWKPTDGGYDFHIASTMCEWALAVSFALFCLTFVSEFRHISLGVNMFLHTEPFSAVRLGNDIQPNERTRLFV
ncbi:DNA damage-regulated autophagy modulator protein 1-like [Asterias amurensis]|uniref:DNA damage-regulated autophagy modulator protein 1-like n=1 Tax=Asterias amurensis TaxID=7602 RepID=UPI003AB1FE90